MRPDSSVSGEVESVEQASLVSSGELQSSPALQELHPRHDLQEDTLSPRSPHTTQLQVI